VSNSGAGEPIESGSPLRRARKVGIGEQVFEVRVAGRDDLVAIQAEASRFRWGAKWSSLQSLDAQVDFAVRALVVPVFWNGGPESEPESLRCHIWFKEFRAPHLGRVSVIDVSLVAFRGLNLLSSDCSSKALIAVILHAPLSGID
jgi:hypothetical protein